MLESTVDLFDPLSEHEYKAWIFQYGHTLASSGEEGTFPMCFIAMR